jgi:UDP-2,3-diacylglucosamine hydrolase
MSLVVISDLHIWGSEDPLYHSLVSLVLERVQPGDTLVLAGDIFDVFVGNKKVFVQEYSRFIESLKTASERGVDVHYIEGNHDFLLKSVFAGCEKVKVHSEAVSFAIEDKKFFVAHGDLANHQDYGYRILRAFLRSLFLRAVVVLVPGWFVKMVGQKSSKYSRNLTPRNPGELPIERRERLRATYRSFAASKMTEGFDYIVMGHCHDLDEKMFKIGSRVGQYVNVGYPRVHGSLLSWQSGEDKISREKLP